MWSVLNRLERSCGGSWNCRDDGWRKREGGWDRYIRVSDSSGGVGMRVEFPQVPSGVPAQARCTLVRTTPKAPSTRPHACLPGRPVAWSPVHSPATTRTESVITEQTAVRALADTRAPHTTCPCRGPTLCVSTRISLCKRPSACPRSLSVFPPTRPETSTSKYNLIQEIE